MTHSLSLTAGGGVCSCGLAFRGDPEKVELLHAHHVTDVADRATTRGQR